MYHTPVYDSRIVANTFLEIAVKEGRTLTNMHLQKLVYFAHGYYLAAYDQPLIEETVQAWDLGPVIPGLYNEFRSHGYTSIDTFYKAYDPIADTVTIPRVPEGQARNMIVTVYNMLKDLSAYQLSNISHEEGSPWQQAYVAGQKFTPIPEDSIRTYFKKFVH